MPQPGYESLIAALDGSVIIYAIIVVIWILSWIVKAIKGENAAGQAGGQPRQPARPRNKRLSDEIDVFLKEVGGARRPRRRRPPPPEEVPIEIVSDTERPPQRRRVKPGEAISRRQGPGSQDLGAEVRGHVKEHMAAGRVEQEVARDLGRGVQSSVARHLGTFRAGRSTESQRPAATSGTAAQIVQMLRDRDGVRQAVLLSEILSQPKGLRRKP